MSLETYKGKSVPALMVRAQRELGDDVRIVEVNRIRGWNDSVTYELVAADEAGCNEIDKTFVTSSNEKALTNSHVSTEQTGGQRRSGPLVVALVGPTGAGKTTTVAKLIGNPRMSGGTRCAALSLDSYRVGAAEQLRLLAEMARVPFAVTDAADLGHAMKRFDARDVIFVDTPGRGPRTQRESLGVDAILSELKPDEIHVAIPSGLSTDITKRLIEEYRRRGATHLLATKLDEAPGDWTVFDIAAQLRMPMRWVTDGQEIPTDIRPARPRLQAAMAGRELRPDFG